MRKQASFKGVSNPSPESREHFDGVPAGDSLGVGFSGDPFHMQQGNVAVKQPPDKKSFRDVCLENSVPAPMLNVGMDIVKDKKARITFLNGNPLLPEFSLDDDLFEALCKPWEEAVIVKLLGKHVGYRTMLEGLNRVWRLKGHLELIDVGKGFFVVKFDRSSDRERVLNDGPWMIYDHYLAISDWRPDFSSETAVVEKTRVWIRFPGLIMLFYDDKVLLGLASVVGRPIKVDKNPSCMKRGRFARVCVEIELNKPVVRKVFITGTHNLKGYWQKIEYEGLHLICSDCGRYGHTSKPCIFMGKEMEKGDGGDGIAMAMKSCLDLKLMKQPVLVRWCEDDNAPFIINSDGSYMEGVKQAGFGVVVRREDGSWITGVSGGLGNVDCLTAELRGIRMAFELAIEFALPRVTCFTDSLEALRCISCVEVNFHPLAGLIMQIRDLMNRHGCLKLRHTFREANGVADWLAKFGVSLEMSQVVMWTVPPDEVGSTLTSDASRLPYIRL